jgi:hypothetical protein
MMQRYSGDFLDAIDGLRALLGCRGRVWPVSVQQASVCAEYGDGLTTRGEVEVDAGRPRVSSSAASGSSRRCQSIRRWARRSRVRRGDHRPRQLLHEPDADLPRPRVAEALAR